MNRFKLCLVAVSVLALTGCPTTDPPDPAAPTTVAAPEVTPPPGTVPDDTGFVVTPTGGDDTQTLVDAVRAHPHVVIDQLLRVDNVAAFGPIEDRTITFRGDGKLVRLARPNTVTFQVMLFTGARNVTLNNPQIVGPGQVCNVNYLDPNTGKTRVIGVAHYREVESQHAISLEGVDRFTINGGYVHDVGGDGVYITRNNQTETPSTNVTINDLRTRCTGRSSISNVHSRDVTVNGGLFELAGMWVLNVEPFNTLAVTGYTVNRPTVGYSNWSWLFVAGPNFSCNIERVTVNQPDLSASTANRLPPTIAGCAAPHVKVNP